MTTEERTYIVPDMTCDHCRQTITEVVRSIPGVAAVDVRLEEKEVHVVGDVAEAGVRQAIDEAGYSVTDVR